MASQINDETQRQRPPVITPTISEQQVVYTNAREYAQALRPWLWQYQNCAMHSIAANFAIQMQALSMLSGSTTNNYRSTTSSVYLRQRPDPYASRRPQVTQNGNIPLTRAHQQQQQFPAQQTDTTDVQGKDFLPNVFIM